MRFTLKYSLHKILNLLYRSSNCNQANSLSEQIEFILSFNYLLIEFSIRITLFYPSCDNQVSNITVWIELLSSTTY